MTPTQTRPSTDQMIEDAYPLVALEARRFRGYPPGVSADDLESLGGEALLAAAAEYGGPPEDWRKFAKFYLRSRMQSFCGQARKRAARHTSAELLVRGAGGELVEVPRADPRAADPAAAAAAREELVRRRPHAAARARDLAAGLPTPAEVAEQVGRLRAAMFGAVTEADIRDVMAGVVDRAKKGNVKDAKLLIDLLAPARSGVSVHQNVQTIVVSPSDVS